MEFEAFLILKEKSFRHSVLLPRFHNVSAHPSLLTDILYRAGELLSNYSLTNISHSICFFTCGLVLGRGVVPVGSSQFIVFHTETRDLQTGWSETE